MKGDKVLFYIGGTGGGYFTGQCTLASDVYVPSGEKRGAISHGSNFYSPDYGVNLKHIEAWEEPRMLDAALVAKL